MASKKKINKIPSGVSFMYAPDERELVTPHHVCEHGGIVYEVGVNKHPGVNRPDALIYGCTKCDWKSPSGEFQHEPTTKTTHHVASGVVKKQAQKKMPRDLRDAVRAEVRRRMEILTAEREQFPPSLLKKGKKWVSNPKFTDDMRTHMNRFYVSSEKIHDALKAGRKLPEYPLKGV